MSRIEKAIEIAARKRNEAIGGTETDASGLPQPQELTVEKPVKFQAEAPTPTPAPATVGVDRNVERNLRQEEFPTITNDRLVMANAPNSPAAEQYRKLKSNIMKQFKLGKGKQSLMITSPMAGEGKTITALNLAISIAQEYDHTVLLIEADLRRPSLLQYLGLEARYGLSDCILDGVPIGNALIKTGIGGLSVLPAGKVVDNPVELFSSNRMKEIMAEINGRYPDRIVIIDTTPLLPFAEPQYIAGLVDGIILVVREHLTTVDKIKRAMEMLKNHNLIGVVNNGVSRVTALGGYYSYYGYRYEQKG